MPFRKYHLWFASPLILILVMMGIDQILHLVSMPSDAAIMLGFTLFCLAIFLFAFLIQYLTKSKTIKP